MIEDKLLDNRIIVINSIIDENTTCEVIKKLLYLDSINNDDISLYINSPGGNVIQGLAIIDCMNFIKSEVKTLCYGMCCSMGAVILANGEVGKRYALPNAEIMIHEVSGSVNGDISDFLIYQNEMSNKRNAIIDILSKKTKKTKKEIIKNIKTDNYMTSEEAKKFGLIDKVVSKSKGV